MGSMAINVEQNWTPQSPPPLPEGYKKHHIVYLEAVNMELPEFSFPYTIEKYHRTTASEVAERIKPATIVLTHVLEVTPADMEHAPHLKLLVVVATGMGWVDVSYCAKRGITAINTPAANIDAVSEHFLGLYFASRKRMLTIDRLTKTTDQWQQTGNLSKTVWPQGLPLGCKQETLGIVGYGALGHRIELLAKALNFREILIAERRGAQEIRSGRVDFEEILTRCTTIVLVCPKTADTINLIDEPELKRMKKEMLLINSARGGIVNEAALAKALREGWIFGAAVDVLDEEPNGPGGSPLLPDLSKGEEEVPNLLITAHLSWCCGTTLLNLQTMARRNITAFVEGEMLHPDVSPCVAVHDGRIWK